MSKIITRVRERQQAAMTRRVDRLVDEATAKVQMDRAKDLAALAVLISTQSRRKPPLWSRAIRALT